MIERIGRRRVSPDMVITPEVGRYLAQVSRETGRQTGILVDRRGQIDKIIVGTAKGIFLPDMSSDTSGLARLRGVRLIHTHLNEEPLSGEDLTDLTLLRLDWITAIGVKSDGEPGLVHSAHLVPHTADNHAWELSEPVSLYDIRPDFLETIEALEEEFAGVRRAASTSDGQECAILVHVATGSYESARESLEELEELARTTGLVPADTVIQKRRKIDPRFVVGRGKLKDLIGLSMQRGAEMMVFDMNLSPGQIRAIADFTELKILDRTQVILDIFAQRATSTEAKMQVELAQLKYLLPRLAEKNTAMSRLTGGIGGRGPGETKLEINRRRVREKIHRLERETEKIGQRRALRRSRRKRHGLPVVSILGYTNAGKSTLLNSLTHSAVTVENKLFATLNPASRRLRFPKERDVIITDTVGLIRDLPPDLMSAFRATFEEVHDADLLVHVVDIANPDFEHRIDEVNRILPQLELDQKTTILLFNKIDLVPPQVVSNLCRIHDAIPISARDTSTFRPLLDRMHRLLWQEPLMAEIDLCGAEKS
jgi:GTP-binding protein HflX